MVLNMVESQTSQSHEADRAEISKQYNNVNGQKRRQDAFCGHNPIHRPLSMPLHWQTHRPQTQSQTQTPLSPLFIHKSGQR